MTVDTMITTARLMMASEWGRPCCIGRVARKATARPLIIITPIIERSLCNSLLDVNQTAPNRTSNSRRDKTTPI